MTADQTFVVIGAGLAGAKAVETLRSEGFGGRVVLVGAEDELPYERPPLSKGVLLGNDEESSAYVHDREWYDSNRVELKLGTRATGLDVAARQVELEGGATLTYDKLLLATGATPRVIDVPGADLDGVKYLRTFPESRELKRLFAQKPSVIVVGAGWIGLETAAAARHYDCAVAVVEPSSAPLSSALGPEMGKVFADLHREHGVDLRLGSSVIEIVGADGKVRGVRTDDGTEIAGDLIVVGIGVRPETSLAEAAGLRVDNGIVTDTALRTSDPHVYAVGDVARWEHPLLGEHIRVEHWANAHDGGPVAARSMLGRDVSYDAVPFFFSDQYDLGMEFAGFVSPGSYDDVVVRGDLEAREFCAFWLSDGRLMAGMNVNVWDVQDQIQALIRGGEAVDTARLANPDVPLEELAS